MIVLKVSENNMECQCKQWGSLKKNENNITQAYIKISLGFIMTKEGLEHRSVSKYIEGKRDWEEGPSNINKGLINMKDRKYNTRDRKMINIPIQMCG